MNRSVKVVSKAYFFILFILLLVVIAASMTLALGPGIMWPAPGALVMLYLGGIALVGIAAFKGKVKKLTTALVGVMLVCAGLHLFLLDGLFGSLFASLGPPHETLYSNDYTGWKFFLVARGMKKHDVARILGKPLVECWIYEIRPGDVDVQVVIEDEKVVEIYPLGDPIGDLVKIGMAPGDVLESAGQPIEIVDTYTRGRNSYRVRQIYFRQGRVSKKISYYYSD